jgi:hypothetical protein
LVGDAKTATSSLGNSVLAYLVTKQTMSGCFHPEVAGLSPSDVYVIDLRTADPESSGSLKASDEADDATNLPAVYLSLSPDQVPIRGNRTLKLCARLKIAKTFS